MLRNDSADQQCEGSSKSFMGETLVQEVSLWRALEIGMPGRVNRIRTDPFYKRNQFWTTLETVRLSMNLIENYANVDHKMIQICAMVCVFYLNCE